jgi:NADPH:quinone reductase
MKYCCRSASRLRVAGWSSDTCSLMIALAAHEIVDDIGQAQGTFPLILESVGGASLAAAIKKLAPRGVVVIFGNSSGEPTQMSFRDFGGANNARIQAFHSFASGPEEEFTPDLALLASLVADGSLKPQIGAERSWRDLDKTLEELRDRRIAGKAVFRID